MAKPTYRTLVHERPVAAPRTVTWDAVLVFLASPAAADAGFGQRVLSLEPPWRRVAEIVDPTDVRMHQTSITLRDDGDTCLLVWSALMESEDATAETLAAGDARFAATSELLEAALETVGAASEAGRS